METREKIINILTNNDFVFLHGSRQVGLSLNGLIQLSHEKADNKYFVCNKSSKNAMANYIEQYCGGDKSINILTFSQYQNIKIGSNDIVVFDNVLYNLNEILDGTDVIKYLDSEAKKIFILETCGIKFNTFATVMEINKNNTKFKYYGLVKEDRMMISILGNNYKYEYLLDYLHWFDNQNEIVKKYLNLRYDIDKITFSISSIEENFNNLYEISIKYHNSISINGLNTIGYIQIDGDSIKPSDFMVTTNSGNSYQWYEAFQNRPIIHDKHSISIDLELTKDQYYELTSELIKKNISFSELILKKIFNKQ